MLKKAVILRWPGGFLECMGDLCFCDHLLISTTLLLEKNVDEVTIRRDWRKYSKEVLLAELALIDWSTDVQNFWDHFESNVVKLIDKVVPLTELKKAPIQCVITLFYNVLCMRKFESKLTIKLKLNNTFFPTLTKLLFSFCHDITSTFYFLTK